MKKIVTLLLLLIHFVSFSQTTKKKVLVVLYDQVDFSTNISLEAVANNNSMKSYKVYDSLITMLNNTLSNYDGEEIIFEPMPLGEKNFINANTSKSYVKKPTHFGVSLDKISNKEFNYILTKNDADFVLFVNFYQFLKQGVPKYDKEMLEMRLAKLNLPKDAISNRRIYYSKHLVDFEVFGKDKKLLLAKRKFRIPLPPINHLNYKHEGKDFETILNGYVRFSIWLSSNISML
jgi:hypothetical protein